MSGIEVRIEDGCVLVLRAETIQGRADLKKIERFLSSGKRGRRALEVIGSIEFPVNAGSGKNQDSFEIHFVNSAIRGKQIAPPKSFFEKLSSFLG